MGQINYHNYEEFFILYLDNELSAEGRRMVEDFVQLHPDLKEELALLQQFKFTPEENIFYPAKEELFEDDDKSTIHIGNYEEWFILYTDDELTPEQKTEMERFIKLNPSLQKEWDLFAKTKLQHEVINFPEKATLYRKEVTVRPMAAHWWKVAVAAVLILGIGLATFSILNKKTEPARTENLAKKVVPNNKLNEPVQNPESQIPVDNIIAKSTLQEKNTNEDVKQSAASRVMKADKKTYNENSITEKNLTITLKSHVLKPEQPITNPEIAVNELKNQPTNNLPVPENNPYFKKDDPKNSLAQKQSKDNVNPENTGVTNKSASPSDIQQASYTDNAFTSEPSNGRKNKLRGFFRKLTRTFEKRTDINATDGDKLLVAGMAINLK